MSKSSLVRDVFNPDKMHSLIFHEDESIKIIIKTFADNTHLRGIFIVNSNEKFIGVITRNDLLLWAKIRLGSGFEDGIFKKPTYNDISKYVLSCKVSDMIHENSAEAYVKEGDDLLKALKLMLDMNLIDVPVLDHKGKVIGDLKLTEILLNIINSNSGL